MHKLCMVLVIFSLCTAQRVSVLAADTDLEICVALTAANRGIDLATRQFCKDANPPLPAPLKCEIGVTTPKQCELNAIRFGSCALFQAAVDLCMEGKPGNYPHTEKIRQWTIGAAKCQTCAAASLTDDVVSIGAKKVCGKVGAKIGAKVAIKVLVRFLGPIGAAYTVGEIGAFAIETMGDIHVRNMERQFACDNLPSIRDMKDEICAISNQATADFESRFCKINYQVSSDNCGPLGLTQFTPDSSCDAIEIDECDDPDEWAAQAEEPFRKAADYKWRCLSNIRLFSLYSTACHGYGNCHP